MIDNHFIFHDKTLKAVKYWLEKTYPNESEEGKEKALISPPKLMVLKEHQIDIVNLLKNYFDEDDHDSLSQLIKGEKVNGKLTFNGNQNQLALFFSELEDKNIVLNQGLDVQLWICYYFLYKSKSNDLPKEFKKETVRKVFTKNLGVRKKKQIKNDKIP